MVELNITGQDFKVIWPMISLVIFMLALLVVDLLDKRGETLTSALFTLFAVAVTAGFTWKLWNTSRHAFDDMLIIDNYSLFFNFIFFIGLALTVLISIRSLPREGYNFSEFYVLLMGATLGMMMMASAGSLIMVFVGIETLSISLYVLAGFARTRQESNEAALKYLLLGAFATGFLLYGIALVYGSTGTMYLHEIQAAAAKMLQGGAETLNVTLIAGMLLIFVGLFFKASIVPFHMWAPDVYQGAPTPVTAFMSTGAKAAAYAVLFRVLMGAFQDLTHVWQPVLYVVAILTIVVGNVTAVTQENIKRMLAYSSIAHAGYLLIAVLAWNEMGSGAIMFYLLAYTLMNLGAFGVLAAIRRSGQANETMSSFAGLAKRQPFYAAMMAIFMFSLAGIPPMAGFVGKFLIFASAIKAAAAPMAAGAWLTPSLLYALVIVAVLCAVISVYFYLRVVVVMYMNEPEQELEKEPVNLGAGVALLISAAGLILMGVLPSAILKVVENSIYYINF